MSNYSATSDYSNAGAPAAPTSSTVLSQQDYLARVDYAKGEIRGLSSNIQEIASLHQRALSSPDSNSSAQLENLVTQTQLKNTQIRDQIKYLELDALKTQDGTKSVKARQAKLKINNKHKTHVPTSPQLYGAPGLSTFSPSDPSPV